MDFEAAIGLETHVQLKTATKLFCRCAVSELNSPANSSICPVCSGQPGALPVPNEKAVQLAAKTGFALNCSVKAYSIFARKNYFYPDLPKGYQISQFENPICENGFIILSTGKKIKIKRAHLEEDAGKSVHSLGNKKLDYTLVDLNRSGVALLEIVSEPDLSTAQETHEYLSELKRLLRWIEVSGCDMEKGELRCDVNVSIRHKGESVLGKKVEIKNLNSFKAAKDAINHEISRQKELLLKGETIDQDTRLWNEKEQKTVAMRSKELAHDYRYFPEPDLPPLTLAPEELEKIKKSVGRLPNDFKKEYMEKYGLGEKEAGLLTSGKDLNRYFSEAAAKTKGAGAVRHLVNLITGLLLAKLNELKAGEEELETKAIKPEFLAEIAFLLSENTISASAAKKVFEKCWDNSLSPSEAVEKLELRQSSDTGEMEKWAREAITLNEKAFEDFKKGNEKAAGPIVGLIMKKSKGQANPQMINEILRKIAG